MRRREFLSALGGAAAAWPVAARAQQARMPVIGFLSSASTESEISAFKVGLSEVDFVDGRNVAIEYRWAHDQDDRLLTLAADLVRRQVNVIVATNNAATLAAKAATVTVPIIFLVSVDPVAFGLAASLSRPGGNLTGVTTLNAELGPKRLQLLRELVPSATTIALLVNPTNPAAKTDTEKAREAASSFGLQLHVLHASSEAEFTTAFAALARLRAGALMIAADRFFNTRSEQLAALTLRYAVPAIYHGRDFAATGGLMSYGGNNVDTFRRGGIYTGRILKGEKPGDLPVQQSTKVELIINLKTARALGMAIPITVLGRADEVIE